MKKWLPVLLLIFSFFFESAATHIVGGGFSYQRLTGNNYRFQLTLYFDLINGNQGARDPDAECHIFSKTGNFYISSYNFGLVSSGNELPFTSTGCASAGFVKTEILIYESIIELSPSQFSDPGGYYIVWERCCRNGGITNLSQPGDNGQTFYMEFPAVRRNNQPYLNSSPVFRTIVSDYPCINYPFQLSFGADDADGDSLAYSLVDPLRGNSSRNDPRPANPVPAPYSIVSWSPGYSAGLAIPGNPALGINPRTGILNLNASQQGLFVFSVLCQEFRSGRKIGEVRREMQLFVKECQPNNPPVIAASNPLSGSALQNNDTLVLEGKTGNSCYSVKLTDEQMNQDVRFRAFPFSANTPATITRDTLVRIISSGDSVNVRICLPPCASTEGLNPWRILLTATDQACGNPQADSLILFVKIKKPETLPPAFIAKDFPEDTIRINQTEPFQMGFEGQQTENANLNISSTLKDRLGQNVPVQANGIVLPQSSGQGKTEAIFSWPEICFLPENQPLKLTSILRSTVCNETKTDTIVRWMFIQPKSLRVNILSSANPDAGPEDIIPLSIPEPGLGLAFELTGSVSEDRPVRLYATGPLLNLEGFQFPGGADFKQVSSPFRFTTNCNTPAGFYRVTFLSESRFCGKNFRDSVSYVIDFREDSDSVGTIPNLLTLNGDSKNDFLSMEKIFPEDNCKLKFKFIRIVNRWGKEVFYSEDIGFRWDAANLEPGTYYLFLDLENKKFKSWIFLLK